MRLCPHCQQPLVANSTKCPHCLQVISETGPEASVSVLAREGGVAAAGDISGPVFTGPISGDVTIGGVVQVEIPPPPPPERPPQIGVFVGRQAELDYYAGKLAEHHLVLITGMPGVGKTTLAVMLARQLGDPYKTFWYSFHPYEGIEDVVLKLAAFLAWNGQFELWRMLNRTRQIGGQQLSWGIIFNYLLAMVRNQGYLLCLDDFHLVDERSLGLLEEFLSGLAGAVRSGEVNIIITSRSRPQTFAQTIEYEPLGGLSLEDTERLIASTRANVPPEMIPRLHAATGGNVQFLTLAVQALQQIPDPSRLVDRLVESEKVEDYLLDAVDQGLTEEERQAMAAVALLLGYPGTRHAIEAILDRGGLRRTLHSLSERHLLTASEGKAGREFGQHAILRAFYYDLPGESGRREMHRRAAHYYAQSPQERDALKAGLHYQQAGDAVQAAELATAEVRTLFNQGRGRVLLHLLEEFRPEAVAGELWAQVLLAQGYLNTLLGSPQPAREQYEAALRHLETLPESPRKSALLSQVFQGMGELLEWDDPEQAKDWLLRGLERIEDGSPLESSLYIKLGSIHMQLGDYPEAQVFLERGLACLPSGPSPLRSEALSSLGMIHFALGELPESLQYNEQALVISQKLEDDYQIAGIRSNLGILKYSTGDWQEAVQEFTSALAIATELSSPNLIVSALVNVCGLYVNLAQDELAFDHLNRALSLARQGSLQGMEAMALFRLGDLHLRRGEFGEAGEALQAAGEISAGMENKSLLAAVDSSLAEIALCQGQIEAAREHIARALALADEMEEDLEQGISLRVRGQIFLAAGEYQAAIQDLERSYALLKDSDIYEAARSQLHLANTVHQAGLPEEAAALLGAARGVFSRLGAKRDLSAAEAGLPA